jgi:biotin carboxyl carrier protein
MDKKKKHFEARVNEHQFEIEDSSIHALDLIKIASDSYHCIHKGQSIIATVRSGADDKLVTVIIDGQEYLVEIRNSLAQMIDEMGFDKKVQRQLKEIKAPMPGLVLEIAVTEAQQMKKGEKLLILEAMKMENSILMPADGTIKKIVVKAGQPVEKGQVIIELE